MWIEHKLIPPRTPWHNGKVERSHRNDQRYFYDWEHFRSLEEFNDKLHKHLLWSNRKSMRTLGRKSPVQLLKEKLKAWSPFYEILFRSATFHFKGFHKTLYLISGIFSSNGSHLLTTQNFICNFSEKLLDKSQNLWYNQSTVWVFHCSRRNSAW